MRTAQECLLKACNCERLADDCSDPLTRLMLLEAAQHWRNLAKAGKAAPEQRGRDLN